MSYGYYSEVYFAINYRSSNYIKIGETTNARRRANQLFTEDYLLVDSLEVGGDQAERLFVESFLRMKILKTCKVQQVRKDYFVCEDGDTAKFVQTHFQQWVSEALLIINNL